MSWMNIHERPVSGYRLWIGCGNYEEYSYGFPVLHRAVPAHSPRPQTKNAARGRAGSHTVPPMAARPIPPERLRVVLDYKLSDAQWARHEMQTQEQPAWTHDIDPDDGG